MKNDEVCVAASLSNRQFIPAEVILLQVTLKPPGKTLLSRLHAAETAIEGWDQGCQRCDVLR
jgi:hypothetical protein